MLPCYVGSVMLALTTIRMIEATSRWSKQFANLANTFRWQINCLQDLAAARGSIVQQPCPLVVSQRELPSMTIINSHHCPWLSILAIMNYDASRGATPTAIRSSGKPRLLGLPQVGNVKAVLGDDWWLWCSRLASVQVVTTLLLEIRPWVSRH